MTLLWLTVMHRNIFSCNTSVADPGGGRNRRAPPYFLETSHWTYMLISENFRLCPPPIFKSWIRRCTCRSVYGLWLAYKVKLLTYTKSNRVNWDMISQFSPIVKKQQQMYTNYLCWYLSLKNTILQTIASYKTYIMYAGCSL